MRHAKKYRQKARLAERVGSATFILPFVRAVASEKADAEKLMAAARSAVDVGQVEHARKRILAGASSFDVRAEIAKAFPGVDSAAIVMLALDGFRRAGNFDPSVMRGWLVEATKDIYRRGIEANDLTTALRATKQMAGFLAFGSEDADAGEGKIEGPR